MHLWILWLDALRGGEIPPVKLQLLSALYHCSHINNTTRITWNKGGNQHLVPLCSCTYITVICNLAADAMFCRGRKKMLVSSCLLVSWLMSTNTNSGSRWNLSKLSAYCSLQSEPEGMKHWHVLCCTIQNLKIS